MLIAGIIAGILAASNTAATVMFLVLMGGIKKVFIGLWPHTIARVLILAVFVAWSKIIVRLPAVKTK